MELWVGQLLSGIILFVLTFIFTVVLPPLIIKQQKKSSDTFQDCEGIVIDNPQHESNDYDVTNNNDDVKLLGENEHLCEVTDVSDTSLLKVSQLFLSIKNY